MNEQDFSEDSPDTVACLRRIIEQLRVNLYSLEECAARYGPLEVPLHVKNAIEETTRQLAEKEAELQECLLQQEGQPSSNTELCRFWEPFVTEGAKFFITQNEPLEIADTKLTVLSLTVQAVFNMYRLLVEQFVPICGMSGIRLELGGALRTDFKLERLAASSHPHLIVIGAPGANPLANYLLAEFKGIAPYESTVTQGYIFRVSGQYNRSPFIVSDEELESYPAEWRSALQRQGIYDLKPGQPPQLFPRTFEQYGVPGYNDQDCATVVTGWATLPGENRIRRVVVISGHSRHSSVFGTTFVVTNEEWARQVNLMRYFNTETIIGLQPDGSGTPVAPSILAGPREIYKQLL